MKPVCLQCGEARTSRASGFCMNCKPAPNDLLRRYFAPDPIPFPLEPGVRLPCMDSKWDFTSDYTTDEMRAVCDDCPAKQWCLARAIEHNDVGTCGGKSYEERQAMKKGIAA